MITKRVEIESKGLGSEIFEKGTLRELREFGVRLLSQIDNGGAWVMRCESGGLRVGWSDETLGRWTKVATRMARLREGVEDGEIRCDDLESFAVRGGILSLLGEYMGMITYGYGVLDVQLWRGRDFEATGVVSFPDWWSIEEQYEYIVEHKGSRRDGDFVESSVDLTKVGISKDVLEVDGGGLVEMKRVNEYYVGQGGLWFMNPYLSWSTIERNLSE